MIEIVRGKDVTVYLDDYTPSYRFPALFEKNDFALMLVQGPLRILKKERSELISEIISKPCHLALFVGNQADTWLDEINAKCWEKQEINSNFHTVVTAKMDLLDAGAMEYFLYSTTLNEKSIKNFLLLVMDSKSVTKTDITRLANDVLRDD